MKIYCQYNYGGYSIFPINCLENERLEALDATKPNDLPSESVRLFNRSGVKLIYEWISNHRLLFSIKYIPAFEIDSTGRHFECGIQWVGEGSEKAVLDALVNKVLGELPEFEQLFAGLFTIQNGLFFKGDTFKDYIIQLPALSAENSIYFDKTDGVLLFIPKFDAFFHDRAIKKKVLEENGIAPESMRHVCYLPSFHEGPLVPFPGEENKEEAGKDFCKAKQVLRKIWIPLTALGAGILYKINKNNKTK